MDNEAPNPEPVAEIAPEAPVVEPVKKTRAKAEPKPEGKDKLLLSGNVYTAH